MVSFSSASSNLIVRDFDSTALDRYRGDGDFDSARVSFLGQRSYLHLDHMDFTVSTCTRLTRIRSSLATTMFLEQFSTYFGLKALLYLHVMKFGPLSFTRSLCVEQVERIIFGF